MRKIKIKVDDFELRLIIRALAEWRNALIAENKPTEDLDELLIRFCKWPLTTEYRKRKHLFSGNNPQENRCFFCTQKAVFHINRQDGINSLPCFFRPPTAKKNGDFHPETMSFQHLITQSGAFCFFGSKKVRVKFFWKRVAVSSFSVGISERTVFSINFFESTPPKTLSHFKQVKGQKIFWEKGCPFYLSRWEQVKG